MRVLIVHDDQEVQSSLRGTPESTGRQVTIAANRKVALAACGVEAFDLPEMIRIGQQVRIGGRVTLEQLENEHISRIIARSSSLDEAATILGVNPATLFRKRRKLLA